MNHRMAVIRNASTDRWGSLNLLDFFGIFLVVKAVSKEVSEVTQGTL